MRLVFLAIWLAPFLLYTVLQTSAFQSTPLLQHIGSRLFQASSTDGSAAGNNDPRQTLKLIMPCRQRIGPTGRGNGAMSTHAYATGTA